MPMLGFDPLYLVFTVPALLLSLLAQGLVKSRFSKYSKVMARSRMTGAEAARNLLLRAGIADVRVERVNGFLSDHYDPSSNTLRLSEAVYGSQSLSALGVACHEAGHALQKANNYGPMALRSMLVLPASLGSRFSDIVIILGAMMQSPTLINVGLIMFGAAVLFTLVTLPVEWDASARAKKALIASGILLPQEQSHAASVLNAAFMTYLASAVSAILTMLYYLIRLGVIGGGKRNR